MMDAVVNEIAIHPLDALRSSHQPELQNPEISKMMEEVYSYLW